MTQPQRVLIVSASDTRFMGFLRDMIASIQPVLDRPNVQLACFDIGMTPADRMWLIGRGARIAEPGTHLGVDPAAHGPALRSFLARPFLREYFPGYDVYVWIDSDIWMQDPLALDRYIAGALETGMAATHETERAYRFQAWLLGWTAKHFILGFGPLRGAWLLTRPHVNAGLFAIAADAPHWDAWAARYGPAIRRSGRVVPHDQFALNHAIHAPNAPKTLLLDPGCNWICSRGVPMWNDAAGAFCRPYPPYAPIAVLHLAGPAKRECYTVRRTGGGAFRTYMLRGATPAAPVTESMTATGARAAMQAAE